MREYKQVMVVRTDLKMSPGKLAVQVAHASVEAVLICMESKDCREWLEIWKEQGMKKVVLRGGGEEDLIRIYNMCREEGLPCSLVRDAGKTELEPGTLTVVGLGPAPAELIDRITGKLSLY
ncbi:MAG: peptidyl-tRNA hydrolase Pth2 [Desulfurococcales archaeon]|jgi:PTH2 family peptidyl-tRNA hydrolase|nr:peptidyl-tRNA hydrolase Pth2 [Desulfurococcales archaeon]